VDEVCVCVSSFSSIGLVVVGLVQVWFGGFGVRGFSSSFSSVGSVLVVRSSVVRGSCFSFGWFSGCGFSLSVVRCSWV